MKNSLSQKEIEDASKRFCEHKGPYLSIDQIIFSASFRKSVVQNFLLIQGIDDAFSMPRPDVIFISKKELRYAIIHSCSARLHN